jgi:hypothetical protein
MAEDGRTHLETDAARGGETPGIARYVLGISLAAIVVLFVIVLLIYR